MKGMADALDDLGEVIHDRTLVLNVLRGLNEKFAHMKAHFKRTKPFPSFDEVRNDLILEEIDSSTPTPPPATALVAAPPRPAPSSTPSGGSAVPQGGSGRPPSTSTGGNSGGGRRRRRGNGGGTGGGKAQSAPWPSFYNPWTGQITMWPGPAGGP